MTFFLSTRDTTSTERMDDPNCSLAELENTYRQFHTINSLISQWHRIYKNKIRPHLSTTTPNSLLDIGFGGGDIPIKLAQWANADGIDLRITAIDPDPRALNFVQDIDYPPNVKFLQASLSDLLPVQRKFDFVISNHLLHHLNNQQLQTVLKEALHLSSKKVIFNDIRRSDWAYLLFNLFARPVFRSSFITDDGLTSIKRSYTQTELQKAVPSEWTAQTLFPFRLLLTYAHE